VQASKLAPREAEPGARTRRERRLDADLALEEQRAERSKLDAAQLERRPDAGAHARRRQCAGVDQQPRRDTRHPGRVLSRRRVLLRHLARRRIPLRDAIGAGRRLRSLQRVRRRLCRFRSGAQRQRHRDGHRLLQRCAIGGIDHAPPGGAAIVEHVEASAVSARLLRARQLEAQRHGGVERRAELALHERGELARIETRRLWGDRQAGCCHGRRPQANLRRQEENEPGPHAGLASGLAHETLAARRATV
jgi:hypothetical protein